MHTAEPGWWYYTAKVALSLCALEATETSQTLSWLPQRWFLRLGDIYDLEHPPHPIFPWLLSHKSFNDVVDLIDSDDGSEFTPCCKMIIKATVAEAEINLHNSFIYSLSTRRPKPELIHDSTSRPQSQTAAIDNALASPLCCSFAPTENSFPCCLRSKLPSSRFTSFPSPALPNNNKTTLL